MLAIMCQMNPVYKFMFCFSKYELSIVKEQRLKLAFIIQTFLLNFQFSQSFFCHSLQRFLNMQITLEVTFQNRLLEARESRDSDMAADMGTI
jgi:hypothetical protein